MIILIDNYDSFTYNLYHYIGKFTPDIEVWRNDKISVAEIIAKQPEAIILSPGPKTPDDAGICLDLIAKTNGDIPIFGVCLGHQSIAQIFGGTVVRADEIRHGKTSTISHIDDILFENIPNKFEATRYHSLTVDPKTLPDCLKVTAKTDDGVIMALAHKTKPIYGVQFHPESIASEYGHEIIGNFLRSAGVKLRNSAPVTAQKPKIMPTAASAEPAKTFAGLKPFIARAVKGETFSQTEAAEVFEIIMSGDASDAQIGSLLTAIRMRGETIDEITGAATIMRRKASKVRAPAHAIDTCGTGGDGSGSYNISTAASFVIAGCGVTIAKHGNRALSSLSGTAQVLETLGVDVTIDAEKVSKCIDEAGIGFLYAIKHHSAMRFVGPARVQMGIQTIFNLLGPLSNPAGVKRQVLGVFAKEWVEPIANVLKKLGSEHVWVVHGCDGLDELTVTGKSFVAELKDGKVTTFEIDPTDYGFNLSPGAELKGGDPEYNAAALREILAGKKCAYRDITILNAAAGLIVAGKVSGLHQGIELASKSIDSGAALNSLNKLVELSNG
ncbi:MAG: bifunctional anthranilate synthase component II/anthranilate phosphoribosyltransferase [Rhizobiales bacterium]|nr:bifunctional anthranilate synthase component II/anthranilate phosphoribosyltransferase [Hyphomicrobiales bacterium]NRB14851.1 bifunctional anthranilate synthase component II/anthranilate phosphoribosyltransferase [Hyphomicrobiales bacterium]